MSRFILIVDDELSIQKTLSSVLQDEGYRVLCASNGTQALELIRANRPDLVLLDIWMPEMDGLETLKRIKAEWADQGVVMMSGHGSIETAVRSTKLGAYDFIEKPLSIERLLVVLQNSLSVQDLARENQVLRKQVDRSRHWVGESPLMKQIKSLIERVAPTTGSVLITGENGTGKEVAARHIHSLSPRFNKPFVEVNCAAIPEELIESELFGHEKGAFTGATQLRRGKFDLAHGGTLFLDEIGDMSFKTQAKILRILQEQKFERVGGTQTISVDVRIVAATNKDLKAGIQKGTFREDLYYRLNVIPFLIPPLRDRKEDIPELANHFLKDMASSLSKPIRAFTKEAEAVLISYPWPGNVRELKNLVERTMILTPPNEEGQAISAATVLEQLKDEVFTVRSEVEGVTEPESQPSSETSGRSLRDARAEFEKDFIIKTLKDNEWNISKTAQILGIERSYLHKKIKSYGIETE